MGAVITFQSLGVLRLQWTAMSIAVTYYLETSDCLVIALDGDRNLFCPQNHTSASEWICICSQLYSPICVMGSRVDIGCIVNFVFLVPSSVSSMDLRTKYHILTDLLCSSQNCPESEELTRNLKVFTFFTVLFKPRFLPDVGPFQLCVGQSGSSFSA